jgi:hypothetical protein
VGPRNHYDAMEKRKISCTCRDSNFVAILTALSGLPISNNKTEIATYLLFSKTALFQSLKTILIFEIIHLSVLMLNILHFIKHLIKEGIITLTLEFFL